MHLKSFFGGEAGSSASKDLMGMTKASISLQELRERYTPRQDRQAMEVLGLYLSYLQEGSPTRSLSIGVGQRWGRSGMMEKDFEDTEREGLEEFLEGDKTGTPRTEVSAVTQQTGRDTERQRQDSDT